MNGNDTDTGGLPIPPLSDEWLGEIRERLRQAIDDSVLTHTGRSIGDVASQRVIDDIWPLITARETALLVVVRAVAEAADGVSDIRTVSERDGYPIYCHGHWAYVPVVFQAQARAALAALDGGEHDD